MTNTPPVIGITAHESLVDDGVGVAVRHHLTHVAYAKAVRKAGGIPGLLPMVDPVDAALFATHVAKVLGATRVGVNSLHHQALDALGRALRPVAYSDDGLVEGVEVEECSFAVGVQWHPELLRHRPEHLALFRALVVAGASNGAR